MVWYGMESIPYHKVRVGATGWVGPIRSKVGGTTRPQCSLLTRIHWLHCVYTVGELFNHHDLLLRLTRVASSLVFEAALPRSIPGVFPHPTPPKSDAPRVSIPPSLTSAAHRSRCCFRNPAFLPGMELLEAPAVVAFRCSASLADALWAWLAAVSVSLGLYRIRAVAPKPDNPHVVNPEAPPL
ncbi:hypothetical protein GW17_00023053 [Ensete ventricosum]|nr:hypothetical protein GW17_00023053 [Ensete ventricosum]